MEAAALLASKVDQPIPEIDTEGLSIDRAFAHVLKKEYGEALKIYLPLADKGNEKANTALISMFKDPDVVRQIIDDCRVASDCGFKVVSYLMGELYHRGNGPIERNDEQALRFYKQADSLGYLRATHRLGMMYYRGDGVPQDYSESLKCFNKVYEYGKVGEFGKMQAAHNIGNFYFFGHGVEKNHATAYGYYKEASDAGLKVSQRQLEKISNADAVRGGMVGGMVGGVVGNVVGGVMEGGFHMLNMLNDKFGEK